MAKDMEMANGKWQAYLARFYDVVRHPGPGFWLQERGRERRNSPLNLDDCLIRFGTEYGVITEELLGNINIFDCGEKEESARWPVQYSTRPN